MSEGAAKEEDRRNSKPSKVCATFCRRSRRCGTASSRPRAKFLARIGFGEIRLPIFEPTEFFARSVGARNRFVSKEMYSFEDRDESSISLRPEATASVVRAYIEHGMQIAARQREALLHGADVPARAAAEGALPAVLSDWRGSAGVFGRAGDRCRSDRDAAGVFRAAGTEGRGARSSIPSATRIAALPMSKCCARELQKVRDKLGADSQRRIETNPLRVLDSKLREEQAIIAKLPRIADHLCDDCRDALRRSEAAAGVARHRVPGKLAAGARARLLHAHDV